MKVGITGGAGFIADWVRDELRRRGYSVVLFDRRVGEHLRIGDDVELMLGDVTDRTAVAELGSRVDGIIHLAAILGTAEWITDARPAAEVNIFGALNVLDAARLHNIPVVNIAVGNAFMRNSYSSTKHCAERLCEQYATQGVRVNQVRAMNAYGARQGTAKPYGSAKVRKVIPAFACRALSGHPIEVFGDGSQVSDCIHVSDVARVLVSALECAGAGKVFDRVVEVGPTEHHTILQVARMVAQIAAELTDTESVPIVHLPMRPGEIPGATVTADTSTLALVGEDPAAFVPLYEGLTQTVEWFAGQRGITWQAP